MIPQQREHLLHDGHGVSTELAAQKRWWQVCLSISTYSRALYAYHDTTSLFPNRNLVVDDGNEDPAAAKTRQRRMIMHPAPWPAVRDGRTGEGRVWRIKGALTPVRRDCVDALGILNGSHYPQSARSSVKQGGVLENEAVGG